MICKLISRCFAVSRNEQRMRDSVFFDHLKVQVIKGDLFDKTVLSEFGPGVSMKLPDIFIEPDWFT